jgi:hypothetical protein
MQNEFYNQPVVEWARQNLQQPVEIRQRFSSRWFRLFVYFVLFSIPVLIVGALVFLKLQGRSEASWWGLFLCGGVLSLPPVIIVVTAALIRQKLVKSVDAEGVRSSLGRRFLWKDLYYVDHVSKIYSGSRKIEDNQLELVFAEGKAIIPPLIHNRAGIWNLINSMPVQVRDDGKVRAVQSGGNIPENSSGNPAFDEIVRTMQELKVQPERNK